MFNNFVLNEVINSKILKENILTIFTYPNRGFLLCRRFNEIIS